MPRKKHMKEEIPMPMMEAFFLLTLLMMSSAARQASPSLIPMISWFLSMLKPALSRLSDVPQQMIWMDMKTMPAPMDTQRRLLYRNRSMKDDFSPESSLTSRSSTSFMLSGYFPFFLAMLLRACKAFALEREIRNLGDSTKYSSMICTATMHPSSMQNTTLQLQSGRNRSPITHYPTARNTWMPTEKYCRLWPRHCSFRNEYPNVMAGLQPTPDSKKPIPTRKGELQKHKHRTPTPKIAQASLMAGLRPQLSEMKEMIKKPIREPIYTIEVRIGRIQSFSQIIHLPSKANTIESAWLFIAWGLSLLGSPHMNLEHCSGLCSSKQVKELSKKKDWPTRSQEVKNQRRPNRTKDIHWYLCSPPTLRMSFSRGVSVWALSDELELEASLWSVMRESTRSACSSLLFMVEIDLNTQLPPIGDWDWMIKFLCLGWRVPKCTSIFSRPIAEVNSNEIMNYKYHQMINYQQFQIMMSTIQQFQTLGNSPLPRFGHSITYYAKDKVCLFGGATGTTGQFSITDNTYTLDLTTRVWKKVEATGIPPSARAAHGAAGVEVNKIVIYGGATGSGGLASDDLFHLDLREGVGIWNIISVNHKTPGKRYGHTLTYSKPFLIVFGGNIGDRTVNDCWILDIESRPLAWSEVRCKEEVPCPRVYHSAALCAAGTAAGMVVVFGGRSGSNEPLNDSWGLRKHRKGHWDWVRAPEKTAPQARYQHSGLFIGSLMLIVGGKTNNVSEILPLEVFDTEISEWFSYNSIQRFRHGTWIHEKCLFIYGGFQLSSPTLPTDSIFKLHLSQLFKNKPNLYNKIMTDLNDSVSSTSSHGSALSTRVPRSEGSNRAIEGRPTKKEQVPARRPNNVNMEMDEEMPVSQKKKRVVMMDPVYGNKNKQPLEAKRALTAKQDIPHMFLNQLMHPKNYMNAEALKFNMKSEHIIMLCDMAEEIIANQPMVLTVKAPLKIFGDIHGQFTDLMTFFALYGCPHENGEPKDIEHYDYVFLGDFVDRGNHSLETICLLLALKVVYPKQIHLIRGNHEDSQINLNFGFRDECAEKLDQEPESETSVFTRLNRLFDYLPLAAVAEEKILCLHGGIGASLNTIRDIEGIRRPLEVMHEVQDDESQLVLDILWSDPTDSDNDLGISPNYLRDPQESGNIVKFGPDRVEEFLQKNNLNMIIRAHECVMDGFERFAGGSLITVFSATDYCRKHKNAGAILIVKTNLEIIPKLIYPSSSNANNWIEDEEQLKKRPPTPPRWKNQR